MMPDQQAPVSTLAEQEAEVTIRPLRQAVVVIDLDGTLCDSRHREHFAQNKDWDAYHALSGEDKPWRDVQFVLRNLFLTVESQGFVETMAITGRNERYRTMTMDWLLKHGINIDTVLMRPDDDYSPATEMKPRLLAAHFLGGLEQAQREVLFILEDSDRMVEAWRNLGFRCWQVAPGGY